MPCADRAFAVGRIGQTAHGAIESGEETRSVEPALRHKIDDGRVAPGKDTEMANAQYNERGNAFHDRPAPEPKIQIPCVKHR